MSLAREHRRRYAYLDFMRVLAAFLVIVNHTNSYVFKALSPADPTWWFSILWYYLSKIAVPLFVMVSGACLLPVQDTYRRAFGRFLRVLIALILFSYVYYLVDLRQTYWTWQKALDIPAFLGSIWAARIADSFWYLYFYLGLMVMLPFLQKLASALKKRDIECFMAVSFAVFSLWPLVTHYAPALALPAYFDVPLFGVFLGLFFAGHYLHAYSDHINPTLCWLTVAVSLAASVWLTQVEYGRVAAGAKYWFMDDRAAPSIFTVGCAIAVMALVKRAFAAREPLGEKAARLWAVLGGCTFGIYLTQELVIVQTRHRVFEPLSAAVNPLLAALLWEFGVFAVTLTIAWAMKKIPLLKRLA
jgi:surface polysaccharide O-acyltransferase-like enzyme